MSSEQLIDLLQIIVLTLATVVVMVTAAFKRDHGLMDYDDLIQTTRNLLAMPGVAALEV